MPSVSAFKIFPIVRIFIADRNNYQAGTACANLAELSMS
jgi:hypothetical protein